ncbi:MAG: hypothetical protein R3Y38_05190 [Rikenellaceae bacterium]
MRKLFVLILSLFITLQSLAAEPLWQGKGRIVCSSDGNEHDDDDWAATPTTLAIIASRGIQDKLTLFTYSDHVWGSSKTYPNKGGLNAHEHMHFSAIGGKYFFKFDNSEFISAVDHPEKAYDAMAREINLSSEENPLFIIAAGPMQVVGEGMNRSDKSKHKYVTIISHSQWNNRHAKAPMTKRHPWDEHTGWTWNDMKEQFAEITYLLIANQNGAKTHPGLFTPKVDFDWVKTAKEGEGKSNFRAGAWEFLYQRLESCQKSRRGMPKEDKYFDASDAGMALFLLTGNDQTSPKMLEEFMCK